MELPPRRMLVIAGERCTGLGSSDDRDRPAPQQCKWQDEKIKRKRKNWEDWVVISNGKEAILRILWDGVRGDAHRLHGFIYIMLTMLPLLGLSLYPHAKLQSGFQLNKEGEKTCRRDRLVRK